MPKKKLKPTVKDLEKFASENPEFAKTVQAMANTPPISNKEIIVRSKKSKKKTKK
jgi:hypothetical protein